MKQLIKLLNKIEFLTQMFYLVAGLIVCALFLLIFGDITGRFFNMPIKGAYEVSEFILVAIAFLPLGFAQLKGKHTKVEIVYSRFPRKLKVIIDMFSYILLIGFFSIMVWQVSVRTYIQWSRNILLGQTQVALPVWWASFIGALGCALLVISLVIQFIRYIVGLSESKNHV